MSVFPEGGDFDNEPHKRRNQILSVLVSIGAMLGYAIMTGIVSIKHIRPQGAIESSVVVEEEEEEEEGEEDWVAEPGRWRQRDATVRGGQVFVWQTLVWRVGTAAFFSHSFFLFLFFKLICQRAPITSPRVITG